jgi:Nucleotidyltransferase domain.
VGYNYYNAPREIKLILDEIVKSYYGILKDNLVGIYLHGSLALGCFNPKVSDIDFLIVVRDKLPLEVKREVVKN